MELTEAWEIVKKQKGNVRLLQAEQDKDGVWVIVYAPVTPGPVVRVIAVHSLSVSSLFPTLLLVPLYHPILSNSGNSSSAFALALTLTYELGETDSVEYRYQLTIEKSNVYSYGKGSGIVSNDKRAKILHSYSELCGSYDEAKAKAEELLPLFESIG